MSVLSRIGTNDYRRTRWKNDGGWTTEIAAEPLDETSGAFRWRVSIADIEQNGPFSRFPDVERDLVLLAGNGIELIVDGGEPHRLDQRFQKIHFAGESAVECQLLSGPTRDFNVMTRRDACIAEVIARPLVGPMVIFAEADVIWLVHVFAGEASARAEGERVALATGETLRIAFDGASIGRVVIEGGGELVLVKLAPPRAAA